MPSLGITVRMSAAGVSLAGYAGAVHFTNPTRGQMEASALSFRMPFDCDTRRGSRSKSSNAFRKLRPEARCVSSL